MYHLQSDGSKSGFFGYPYLLSQLLKNHNQSQKFEILNLGSEDWSLLEGASGLKYSDTCEFRQLLQSQPDIVISMTGAKDSFNEQEFTPDAFKKAYKKFIGELRAIDSQPFIMLITPIYSLSSILPLKVPIHLSQQDLAPLNLHETALPAWSHAQTNMGHLVS